MTGLESILEASLMGWAAVFFRMVSFLAWMPFWQNLAYPRRMATIASIYLSLVYWWGAGSPTIPMPEPVLGIALILGGEILLGTALGLIIRVVLVAARGMGQYISQSIGLGFAFFVDPNSSSSMHVVDQMTWTFMVLMVLLTDTHLILLGSLFESFSLIPVGQVPVLSLNGMEVAAFGSKIFYVAMRLASPAMCVGFMIYVALAILAKVAPQMNLFAFGFALTIPGGLVAMGASAPQTMNLMADELIKLPETLARFLVTGAP